MRFALDFDADLPEDGLTVTGGILIRAALAAVLGWLLVFLVWGVVVLAGGCF